MGIELSKPDQPTCSSRARTKKDSTDDGQSKATASTEDSITLPPSPLGMSFHGTRSLHGSTQDGEASEVMRQAQFLTSHHDLNRNAAARLVSHSSNPRTELLRVTKGQHTGIRNQHTQRNGDGVRYGQQQQASSYEGDDAQYLTRLYDHRTWEMYRRITEYRKNSGQACHDTEIPVTPAEEVNDEWENLQQEVVEAEDPDHEMVFLFDFDY